MTVEIQYDKIFDSQRHYRLLLDSMARPGKINVLPFMELAPPEGIHAASVLVGFSLLNADACFCVTRPDRGSQATEISRYLAMNTAGIQVAPEGADFIFLRAEDAAGVVGYAKFGTLSYPEDSATLVIDVTGISNQARDGALALTLKGPGIEGASRLFVTGLHPSFFEQLKTRNEEFPLGIDCILTDTHRQIVCIPRSTGINI